MKIVNQILNYFSELFNDRSFLKFIHITENIVSKVLSIALIVVIFVSIGDLLIVLSRDLFAF